MHGNLEKNCGFIKEKTKYARFKRINPLNRWVCHFHLRPVSEWGVGGVYLGSLCIYARLMGRFSFSFFLKPAYTVLETNLGCNWQD